MPLYQYLDNRDNETYDLIQGMNENFHSHNEKPV